MAFGTPPRSYYLQVEFDHQTWNAWAALHNFWLVHKALMRTLGAV